VASPDDRRTSSPEEHRHGYRHLADFRADANPQVMITDEVRRQQAGLRGAA